MKNNQIMKKLFNINSSKWLLLFFIAVISLFSCKKNEVIGEDPYKDGKQPLGIKFISKIPDPQTASPGDEVTVSVAGLAKYKSDFKIYINELEAQVTKNEGDMLTFKVPVDASTGAIWISTSGQTFFGPLLKISGKLSLDQAFLAKLNFGPNQVVFDASKLANNSFILGGAFTNFNNLGTDALPISGIAQISAEGAYSNSLSFGMGTTNGRSIYAISRIESGTYNGKYMIAGNLNSFDNKVPHHIGMIYGITRLKVDGRLDTAVIQVVNPDPTKVAENRDTVPAFMGGVSNVQLSGIPTIRKMFLKNDRIYCFGHFDQYVKPFYYRSTYKTKYYDRTYSRQMLCLKMDGTMDSTFHFNATTKRSPEAGNGSINDVVMLTDGSFVLAGDFTTFNGISKNRIVKINSDGSIDPAFQSGSGFDGEINSITYNSTTRKIMVTGNFKSYNGQPKGGVVMLNEDGTADSGFDFGELNGGLASFAGQLKSGKIIVAGNFRYYGGVLRQGFMVLNPNGTLAPGYNNTGVFEGRIFKMEETTSSEGAPAVLLAGLITRFDNYLTRNVIKVQILN